MECPKCGIEIDDKVLVCPNCKKVLRLECPICHTINKSNTCHKCGYIIISKCHKCGKINPTINGKCSKCGFDTNVSAILQDSNIDEFACVSIKFPNIKDLIPIFGSKKLYAKFNDKLNGLIYDYVKSIGLKRGLIEDTYIIRFNKDYTYAASVKNAVKSSIQLLNLITQLNYKLTKQKDVILKCNIAILKRDAYSSSEDYKSGVNINLIYQQNLIKNNKLLSNLQLIADGSVYEQIGTTYPMESIGITRVKDKNLFLYQMNLEKYINLEFDEEQEDGKLSEISIPEIIDEGGEVLDNEESIYDIQGITFDEINCEFAKEMTQGLGSKIAQRFMSRNKNIIVVKGKRKYQPRTVEIVEKISQNNIFKNIHRVTCYDEMKYKPYGFFSDLISGLFAYNVTGKLSAMNNFSYLKSFDVSGFIPDVINLTERENPHPEDIRFGLFESFEQLIPYLGKSLIIVEDVDKIDDTSFEIIQEILKNFDKYNISFLFTAEKDFSLHKTAHFLLGKPEYAEITLKPTPIKTLLELNHELCKNVLNTFYMRKIAKNAKGSQMYFMQALVHLMDLGIFVVNKGSLELAKSETALFPTTLDELIQRRLLYIKTLDANLFKLFACMLFMGPQLDLNSIKFFNNPNIEDYLKVLDAKGFTYFADYIIQIQNYNLYYENIMKLLTYEEKRSIANFLISYFFKENAAHPVLAKLYALVESTKNEFVQWENLSNICRSLGDFSAYLNCSLQFLKVLSKNINEFTTKPIEEYKIEVYENIATLLYKYTPDKIANITQIILDNLEAGMNDKKVINLCNKIMQGCLISGKYNYALLMSHKILSRFEQAGVNPSKPDFNVHALIISLIKIEILFNVGDLEDCIVSGEELFNGLLNIQLEEIRPKTVSQKQFQDLLIDSAGYVILAKILQLKTDTYKFCEVVERVLPNLPDSYKLFAELDNLIHGKKVSLLPVPPAEDNKFGGALYYIIKSFNEYPNDPNNFAIEIYRAKLKAKESGLNQVELFCDLMIGKCYMELENEVKASAIISSVLESSQNNGLKNLFYVAAYLTALLSLNNNDISTAYGIISNQIVELEKNSNSCDYILMLYKLLYSKVLKIQKEEIQASFCYNQAKAIAEQHSIKL